MRPGDTLGLLIWENVDDGLLATNGANASQLEEIQVDGDGFIFVPYAGRIRAAGNTPEGIRRIITEKLEAQTPDPQVVVKRLAGDGATVSLIGGVGAQGVYAIERPTRTLTAMLAQAGGITLPPEITQITLILALLILAAGLSVDMRRNESKVAVPAVLAVAIVAVDRSVTALGGQHPPEPY